MEHGVQQQTLIFTDNMNEEPFSESWQHLRMRDRPKYIQELLTDGRAELADHTGQPKARPPWFDESLYKR